MSEHTIDGTEAYRQAGVDLDVSNMASQIATDWAQTTWKNRAGLFGEPTSLDTHFASVKRLNCDELRARPDVDELHSADGAGTKPRIAVQTGMYAGLGWDLAAMALDDIPVEGGQPVSLDNILTINRLTDADLPHIEELFRGLAEAANKARIALYTGEIAVHPDATGTLAIDWAADATGLIHRDRTLTGAKIGHGDELWGFAEPEGFRCNGFSAVSRAFTRAYGEDWHLVPLGDTTLGERTVAPSTLYSPLMTALTGGYRIEVEPKADIHGAVHITGGGIPEKVGRLLRNTVLGAEIDDLFDMPDVMRHAQIVTEVQTPGGSYRAMTDQEMLSTWHGGQGYIVAISEHDAEAVHSEAAAHGIIAKRIGRVIREPGIRVVSNGAMTPGELLSF